MAYFGKISYNRKIMANKEASGFSFYFRTLPNGDEEPCGVRLNLAKVQPKTVLEAIMGQVNKCINVALILNGDQPPLEYLDEDLGISTGEREKMLQGVAVMAGQWATTLIIMRKGNFPTED